MLALDARKAQVFEVVAEEACSPTLFRMYAVAGLGMPSWGRLHLWRYEKFSMMEFGHVGWRIEKFAIFGGSKDVADGGGIEVVRAEEFEGN